MFTEENHKAPEPQGFTAREEVSQVGTAVFSGEPENRGPLTYGEKAVGITFNPGRNPAVEECKRRYAEIIDNLNTRRENSMDPEQKHLLSIAITEAQGAQMWAVKAITWNS